jgi:hypothetical protein
MEFRRVLTQDRDQVNLSRSQALPTVSMKATGRVDPLCRSNAGAAMERGLRVSRAANKPNIPPAVPDQKKATAIAT